MEPSSQIGPDDDFLSRQFVMLHRQFLLKCLCIGFSVLVHGQVIAQIGEILVRLDSLRVESENTCTNYDRDAYRYSQSLEPQIVDQQGGAFSPYDGTCFNDLRESDIEHIVALREAHNSGMCAQTSDEKLDFASDLLNLTLATPSLNRFQKGGKDFAEWKPSQNGCWYASQIVKVKSKYNLSIDPAEKDSLLKFILNCNNVDMEVPMCNIRTSISMNPHSTESGVSNFPNPVSDWIIFVIDVPSPTTGSIQLFDLLGREVLSLSNIPLVSSQRKELRLNNINMPVGIYLYRITVESNGSPQVYSGRFVMQR